MPRLERLRFQTRRLVCWLVPDSNSTHLTRVTDVTLAKVGLEQFSQTLPRQLSGGMAQWVANDLSSRLRFDRALVTQPAILLLDEPFSALDAFTRMKLQDYLLQVWAADRPTMLLVTHDIEEALVLSDRVIVIRGTPGQVHQEFTLDLSRPRKRTDSQFQFWKQRLLDELDLSPLKPTLSGV